MNIVTQIFSILLGILTMGKAPGSAEPSALGKLGALATLGGGVLWLFGPGRAIHYDLNLVEMLAILLFGIVVAEFLYKAEPPK